MHKDIRLGIVDDHTMFRKGLIRLLDLFTGCKVVFEAANGDDMIKQLQQVAAPDIVLMDITMPVMDGFASTEWLQENFQMVKVLALSTMDDEIAIIKMIRCGARGYVLKDAEPDELRQAFRELMNAGFYYNEMVTRKIMKSLPDLVQLSQNVPAANKVTDREMEFLRHCCSDFTYKEIAEKMFLSSRTVEGYRDSLCQKFDVKSRVGLAMYAVKHQLVDLRNV